VVEIGGECGHGCVRGSLEEFAGEFSEPPFDEIQPAAARRREMKRDSRVAQQPPVHCGGLVGARVVEYDVDIEAGWDRVVDGVEKLDELDRAVS